MELQEMYDCIISALNNKKPKNLKAIDIHELTTISHYFVICNGTSTTHIKSLADEVEVKMKEKGVRFLRREGYNSARWILLDYGEMVIHIFHEEDRDFYNLERLWNDGKIVDVSINA